MIYKLPYLAGLIDGEGNISICKRRAYGAYLTHRYSLRLALEITHKETVDWVAQNFGGAYNSRSHKLTQLGNQRKISYRITWSGQQALKLLETILPYLITKKQEAIVAIDYQQNCPPKTYKLNLNEINRRERAYQSLRKTKV